MPPTVLPLVYGDDPEKQLVLQFRTLIVSRASRIAFPRPTQVVKFRFHVKRSHYNLATNRTANLMHDRMKSLK